jgi:hypothetical protein
MSKKKLLYFDLDGAIYKNNKYKNSNLINHNKSKPILNAAKVINEFYNSVHKIVIYTASGMTRYDGNISLVKKKLSKLIINSLKSWNLRYYKLVFGKIYYDFIIDDKAIDYKQSWMITKFKKI